MSRNEFLWGLGVAAGVGALLGYGSVATPQSACLGAGIACVVFVGLVVFGGLGDGPR